jgi:hypothetical protein
VPALNPLRPIALPILFCFCFTGCLRQSMRDECCPCVQGCTQEVRPVCTIANPISWSNSPAFVMVTPQTPVNYPTPRALAMTSTTEMLPQLRDAVGSREASGVVKIVNGSFDEAMMDRVLIKLHQAVTSAGLVWTRACLEDHRNVVYARQVDGERGTGVHEIRARGDGRTLILTVVSNLGEEDATGPKAEAEATRIRDHVVKYLKDELAKDGST